MLREYKWDFKFEDSRDAWILTDEQRDRILMLLKTMPSDAKKRKQIGGGLHSAGFKYSDFVAIYGHHFDDFKVTTYTLGTVIWHLQQYYGSDCLEIK